MLRGGNGKMGKALVIGSGGLKGAYSAGVVAELCRLLEPGEIEAVYASSVGVFAGTFFAANQPDTIEETWRTLVCDRQLVDFWNIFQGKTWLDLSYLINIFKNERSYLDVETVFASGIAIFYSLTEYASGRNVGLRITRENMFQAMMASSALPLLHPTVLVNGTKYTDGGLSNPLPVSMANENGHDVIIAISNNPLGVYVGGMYKYMKLVAYTLPVQIRRLIHEYEGLVRDTEKLITQREDVVLICPERPLPLRDLTDTDKARINATLDMGIRDARRAISRIHKTRKV